LLIRQRGPPVKFECLIRKPRALIEDVENHRNPTGCEKERRTPKKHLNRLMLVVARSPVFSLCEVISQDYKLKWQGDALNPSYRQNQRLWKDII
jgi:hypothetical protein